MPFDGLPEGVVSDMVKLRIALDGVCRRWSNTSIGAREIGGQARCAALHAGLAAGCDRVGPRRDHQAGAGVRLSSIAGDGP